MKLRVSIPAPLEGYRVVLRKANDPRLYFRDEVVRTAELQYQFPMMECACDIIVDAMDVAIRLTKGRS